MANLTEDQRSAEYEAWLDEVRIEAKARSRALASNPDGGIHYKPHPLMVHSGQFWRCKHGSAPSGGCLRCAIRHPIYFLRWHGVIR